MRQRVHKLTVGTAVSAKPETKRERETEFDGGEREHKLAEGWPGRWINLNDIEIRT